MRNLRIPQVFTLIFFFACGENVGKNQTSKKALSLLFCTQTRGRTGMDVTPLVFETSASTDSAIWAFVFVCVCKGKHIFSNPQVK